MLYFHWLLTHAGLPVGTWAALSGHDASCTGCSPSEPESISHTLWTCPTAHRVWCAVACLLTRAGVHDGFLTWGSVHWLLPDLGPHLFFEGLATDPVFMLTSTGYRRGDLSMIPAILGIVIMLVSTDMTMRIVAMSMGSVLSGLIGTLTMGKNTSKQEEMSEKIMELQLKYQQEYKCPKCGKQYSLDLHWKKLQADGKCPFGCGAEFVKNTNKE